MKFYIITVEQKKHRLATITIIADGSIRPCNCWPQLLATIMYIVILRL